MRVFPLLLLFSIVTVPSLLGGEPPATANPLTENQRFVYGVLRTILVAAAETMPEEEYAFRPVESVRTFGQIVGHVADSQYFFCSMVREDKNPAPRIEKSRSTKADLITALHDAFAYCDATYDGMTDESGSESVTLHRNPRPKLGVMMISQSHVMEHYGNLVTYLRMKNLVPPTSDPEFMKTLMKE